MKLSIILCATFIFILSGCDKIPEELKITTFPVGKWKSVSFYNGTSWQQEVTLHYFEIKSDDTYSFRDHNGTLCSGRIRENGINHLQRISFQNSNCGLTDRTVINLSNDSLELVVDVPPNITHDRVKYVKE